MPIRSITILANIQIHMIDIIKEKRINHPLYGDGGGSEWYVLHRIIIDNRNASERINICIGLIRSSIPVTYKKNSVDKNGVKESIFLFQSEVFVIGIVHLRICK